MKDFSEEMLATAFSLGGERREAGLLHFPAPPPVGFQDFALSTLTSWEGCVEARFVSRETGFGFSVFPNTPTIYGPAKHLGNQPRPAVIARLNHFLPGETGDLIIHPAVSLPGGRTKAAMAVTIGALFVYNLKNPQAPRLVHATPLLPTGREEVREAVRKAVEFFHKFAAACDLNAFPWSEDAGLSNTIKDLRQSLGKPAQTKPAPAIRAASVETGQMPLL